MPAVSRAQRLLDLLQTLRRYRFPVTGSALATELGISLRTLYRDIHTLQEQGARIEGEAGLGYVLRPGFMLPPLMFTEEEIEAIVLGSRWVAERGDARLAEAARNALTRIRAVLPESLHLSLDTSSLLVGPSRGVPVAESELAEIRRAIRTERKLAIVYRDLKGVESRRTIWPFALGYFDHLCVLVAWCEMRQGYRHFRSDQISTLVVTEQRYPRRRQALLKEWREQQGIAAQ